MLNLPRVLIGLAVAGQTASAQDLSQKVWAVFAYTLHGDSTPAALPQKETLTPYGASELYAAGSSFRDRYIASDAGDTRIRDITPDLLDIGDVVAFSTIQQPDMASAQAFLQGLYPPLDQSENTTYPDSSMQLANGSLANAPLGGYQYPRIITYGLDDPKSIPLNGQDQCPMHETEVAEYESSEEFQELLQTTEAFYYNLYDQALSGVYDRSSATYTNAVEIAEYLDYEKVHNETFMHNLVDQDIELARYYANKYRFATSGLTPELDPASAAKPVRTIAGRALGSQVLGAFEANIDSLGTMGKMNLAFGGPEAAISLASLMQLSERYGEFYPSPELGGSLIFELYSLERDDDPFYPDPSNLYVRFLVHNGTDSSTSFTTYPLFGHGPSSIELPYSDFKLDLEEFSLQSTREWCLMCESPTLFCIGILGQNNESSGSGKKKGLSLAGAGGIGAAVTIAVFGLIGGLAFLFTRFRKHKSSRGGFKGDRRMASDTDVTFKNPVWGDGNRAQESERPAGGHRRLGSWEMRNKERKASNSSTIVQKQVPLNDDAEDELLIHSTVEPAKVREYV